MSTTLRRNQTVHEPRGPEEIYRVRLDGVFEGPMDLLVHLIRKNEVDIRDIPIALITDQYLGYLEWMRAMNIDMAGEFLVMAATLAQVKSKMLLPVHGGEGREGLEEEDPRLSISGPLLEYLRIKSAAELLGCRPLLGHDTFVRPPGTLEPIGEEDDTLVKVGLFELIDAFQRIIQNIAPEERVQLTAERISVKERIAQIVDILEARGSATFAELFGSASDRAEVIVTFLAVLEMVKLQLVRVVQHVQTGIIRLFYL